MPPRLVAERFAAIFRSPPFTLSDDTAFALRGTGAHEAITRLRTTRDLSRALAGTERYDGRQVIPLAEQFGVSTETMAIRLEELGLLRA
jgi:hypothetical protein